MLDNITSERGPKVQRRNRLRAFASVLMNSLATCRDYYAAAAIYEELSRLSDAELQHRGFQRACSVTKSRVTRTNVRRLSSASLLKKSVMVSGRRKLIK